MAWNIDEKHSGIAVMQGDADHVTLTALSNGVQSLQGVVDFVAKQACADTVIAIDASLIVKNETGQRPCETEIGRAFGRYHASCHTSNLSRPHARTGMKLVDALQTLGFRHDFDLGTARERPGKWLFEVYPHPAMIRLFGLQKIISYKKGSTGQRRTGLSLLRNHMRKLANDRTGLVTSALMDELLDQDLEGLRGQGLKHHEDILDAVFCSYLAWHCWRWGVDCNEMYGTLAQGYIVVPKAVPLGAHDAFHR